MKRILFFGAAFATILMASASPITPEEALSRIPTSGPNRIAAVDKFNPQLKFSLKDANGDASIYVFDKSDNQGYMILSADNAITPVLGYSTSGTFNPDEIVPALQYWLNEYNRQIEFARSEGLTADQSEPLKVSLPTSWTAIAPLVSTKWNQDAPYNILCPLVGNSYCYTGCVATSMSQIMKHWNYPEKGIGSINYTCSSLGKSLRIKFSDITFDWDNMLDVYQKGSYNSEQATAVATLMQAAGYSVQMEYTTQQSGAVSGRIPGAFINYFGYDKGVKYLDRNDYSYQEWAGLIYDNLKNNQPVIYDGTAPNGGHSFVCDGYNGEGYFHINWGWGGAADGYFLLDALAPSSIGIGGAAGGFNFDQDCVLDIKPASEDSDSTVQADLFLYGSIKGEVLNNNLYLWPTNGTYLGIGYQGANRGVFSLGVSIEKYNDSDASPVYIEDNMYRNFTAIPAQYIMIDGVDRNYDLITSLSKANLETGVTYKVTVCYKPETGDWTEVVTDRGCYNYVLVTKNSDSSYSVENFEVMEFTAKKLELTSELYANNAVGVEAQITNDNDIELTRCVQLVLLDDKGAVKFTGDPSLLTLEPGGSQSMDWITSLTASKGVSVTKDTELYLALYDDDTNTIYYQATQPVIMKPAPAKPTFTAKVVVDDAESTTDIYGQTIYTVENGNDFDVTTSLSIIDGYFSSQVTLNILENTTGTSLTQVINFPYPLQFINAGETKDFTVKCNFPTAELNKDYYLAASTYINGSYTWLLEGNTVTTLFRITGFSGTGDDTAVKELTTGDSEILFIRNGNHVSAVGGVDGIASVSVVTLNGAVIPVKAVMANGQADIDLTAFGKGIFILKATDRHGNVKSIKLAL